jgi:hypothetical protein
MALLQGFVTLVDMLTNPSCVYNGGVSSLIKGGTYLGGGALGT